MFCVLWILLDNVFFFSSTTKYDSGTGWPSFYASVEDEVKGESNVMVRHDDSLGMSRTEVICRKVHTNINTNHTACFYKSHLKLI